MEESFGASLSWGSALTTPDGRQYCVGYTWVSCGPQWEGSLEEELALQYMTPQAQNRIRIRSDHIQGWPECPQQESGGPNACWSPGTQWECRLHFTAQSCLTLCNTMDCSPPDCFVHGILQARILEWVAMPSTKGSSQPRDQTQVSCIASRFFTDWAHRKATRESKWFIFKSRDSPLRQPRFWSAKSGAMSLLTIASHYELFIGDFNNQRTTELFPEVLDCFPFGMKPCFYKSSLKIILFLPFVTLMIFRVYELFILFINVLLLFIGGLY